MNDLFFVYVILCDDGSLYKGYTNNIERRYKEHCAGTGSRHTKRHKPVKLVYFEEFSSEQDAKVRERYLKTSTGIKWLKAKLKTLDSE